MLGLTTGANLQCRQVRQLLRPSMFPKRQKRSQGLSRAAKAHPAPDIGVPGVVGTVLLSSTEALTAGKLVKRYKRFLADIQVDAAPGPASEDADEKEGLPGVITVHCPNSGSMAGLLDLPLAPCYVSTSTNTKRKYAHTLELIQLGDAQRTWVGAHAAKANAIARTLMEKRLLPQLGEYDKIQAEVKYGAEGKSRVDFVLHRIGGGKVYVEVKCVTLAEDLPEGLGRVAMFPDAVTKRGQRHVQDLMDVVQAGSEAASVYIILRGDCTHFAPCHGIDPAYGKLVLQAAELGVRVIPVSCGVEVDAQSGLSQVKYLGLLPILTEHKLPLAE